MTAPHKAKGYVTGDVAWPPSRRESERGAFYTFTVLVHEKWDGGERKQYFPVCAFGPAAEAASALRQGDLVDVFGDLRKRSFEKVDKATGKTQTVYETEIHTRFVDGVTLKQAASVAAPDIDDELPY